MVICVTLVFPSKYCSIGLNYIKITTIPTLLRLWLETCSLNASADTLEKIPFITSLYYSVLYAGPPYVFTWVLDSYKFSPLYSTVLYYNVLQCFVLYYTLL